MDGIGILAVAAVVAAVAVGAWLRTGTRLQRRLFVLFLLLSWIPALAVFLLQTRLQRRAHELVESPGLHRSLDSSLALARRAREVEEAAALALAERVRAAGPDAAGRLAPEGWAWRDAGGILTGGASPPPPRPVGVEHVGPVDRPQAVATVAAGGDTVTVVVDTDPDVARWIDDIQQGSAGLRQIGLYYGQLVRWEVVATGAVVAGVVLLLALVLSRRLARQIGEPVQALARATWRIAAGDLDHRVPSGGVDEIGGLVDAFNRMTADLRESKETLRRTERIAAWQGVARRLAHEIKNPLTPIHLSIHRMRGKTDDPTMRECLDTVLEETENLRRLAEEFSTYGRLPEPELRRVDVRILLESVLDLHARRFDLTVDWSGWEAEENGLADEGLLRQVLANLVKNAGEATGERGTLRVGCVRRGGVLRVELADDGPGLPDPPERVFEADFTTKGSGTGLGLAISRKIVEDQGGALTAHPGPHGGAVLRLDLPVAEEDA